MLTRAGLGAMLVTAGVHKLLDPAAWTVYVTDWLAPLLVVSSVVFVLVDGWLETVGLALLADRYTAFAAAVAAVSFAGTVGHLLIVRATTGRFGDVLARDGELAGLALAVFADAIRGTKSRWEGSERTGQFVARYSIVPCFLSGTSFSMSS